ncbi:hypothetical protein D9M71_87750 [compost metagenome]
MPATRRDFAGMARSYKVTHPALKWWMEKRHPPYVLPCPKSEVRSGQSGQPQPMPVHPLGHMVHRRHPARQVGEHRLRRLLARLARV